jgi:hypothetical protein
MHLSTALVDDAAVRALAPLRSLSSLSLGDHKWEVFRVFNQKVPKVTDEGMRALSPITTLTCLDISGCARMTNEGVRSMTPLTALTSLNLACCARVTSVGVRLLAQGDQCRRSLALTWATTWATATT